MKVSRLNMKPNNRSAAALGFATAAALALGASSPASAQLPDDKFYQTDTFTNTYESLDDRGVTTTENKRPFSSVSALITLPFTYNFLGTDYTSVRANVSGYISFTDTTPFTNTYSTGIDDFPDPGQVPNHYIAPFWFQLGTGLTIVSGTVGTAPNRSFVIEYQNVQLSSGLGNDEADWQIWLNEDGTFEVHFDGNLDTARFGTPFGVTGYENSGRRDDFFGEFLPCSLTENCTVSSYNTSLSGNRVEVTLRDEPEFGVDFESVSLGALPGESATATVAFINRGQNTATGVEVDVYLSSDDELDTMADTFLGTVTADAPNGRTTQTIDFTVPLGTPTAQFFVIAEIDPSDAFPEVIEDDNTAVAETPFFTGFDVEVVGCQVTNNGGVNPGDTMEIDATIRNNGAPFVGITDVRVTVSADPIPDGSDPVVGVLTTPPLTGLVEETVRITGAMPAVAPGAYFLSCQVDSNRMIDETNENNNLYFTEGTFQSGADYSIVDADMDGDVDITFAAEVPLGSSLDVDLVFSSLAVPTAQDVEFRLYASEDQELDLGATGDEQLGSTFTASFDGVARTVEETVTVTPPSDLGGGRYFIIAQLDPRGRIAEVDETNNIIASSRTFINATDFAVTAVSFEAFDQEDSSRVSDVRAGDRIEVEVTVESGGLDFSGFVPVSIFLSSDPGFDFGDEEVFSGQIFIAGQGAGIETVTDTFTFPLPSSAPPGCFNVAAVIDPQGDFNEADEINNSAIRPGTPAPCGTNGLEVQGSDLTADAAFAPEFVFSSSPTSEATFDVEVTIQNRGPLPATFTYTYLLSDDDIIRARDEVIFTSPPRTLGNGESNTWIDTVVAPVLTSTASLFLGVVVDEEFQVPDPNRANNITVASIVDDDGNQQNRTAITFVQPAPDFRCTLIATATTAAGGETLSVTRSIENIGNANSADTPYAYYLSLNETISTQDDILLESFDVTLPVGEDDISIDNMIVPADIPEGQYFLAALINPNGAVREVFQENNTCFASERIDTSEAVIQFVTRSFPRATSGVNYEVGAFATGGSQPITWALGPGSALPPGLTLEADTGIISGVPTTEGLFEFTLRALSGTAFTAREFVIIVTPPTVSLTIVSPALPSAIANRDYRVQLIAAGGAPPYTWTLVNDDVLPAGLTFDSATGVLSGRPTTPSNPSLFFRVDDALPEDIRASATRELPLRVLNPNQTVQIQQVPIPQPVVEVAIPCTQDEGFQFNAINGTPPYTFAVVGDAPPGMEVTEDGVLCGTPTLAGVFPFELRAQDESGLFDTALFVLEVDDGSTCSISTFSLPAATEGDSYTQDLSTIRCADPVTFSLVEGLGDAPPGLSLDGDSGTLSGTPTEEGQYGFSVQVEDGLGRIDTQVVSINVQGQTFCQENPSDDLCSPPTGCTSVDGQGGPLSSTSLFLLVLGGLAWAARRREGQSV